MQKSAQPLPPRCCSCLQSKFAPLSDWAHPYLPGSPHFLAKARFMSTVFGCASAPTTVVETGCISHSLDAQTSANDTIAAAAGQQAASAADIPPCAPAVENATRFDIVSAACIETTVETSSLEPSPAATTNVAVVADPLEDLGTGAIIDSKALTMSIEYDAAKTELGNKALALTKPVSDEVSPA